MNETTDISWARHAGYIGPAPKLNRITGTFADPVVESRFLEEIWPERRKLGLAVGTVLLISSVLFGAPTWFGFADGPSTPALQIWIAVGIGAFATSLWCLFTNKSGWLLDLSLFAPGVAQAVSLAEIYGLGGMPWTVVGSLLMTSMFVYGVFLPHRPLFAMAMLAFLLGAYLGIGIWGQEFANPVPALMEVGIWIACMLMVRNTAISKRERSIQNAEQQALTRQLDRHLQDLGLEKGAVERAATENAALADELALARMAAEENAAILEIVLNNMSQGVLAYGPDARVIECNRRFAEFMRLPEHLTTAGTPVEAIFQHGLSEGVIGNQKEHDHAVESVRSFAQMRDFEPVVMERESAPDLFIEVRIMPLPGGGAVSTVTNITERKLAEESMRFKALHDPLTGLANRELFGERLRAATARSRRSGHYAAIAMIDLDHFKPVNDTYGHPAGDVVLRQIGAFLTESVREIDTVARLGGDEFAIIFDGIVVLRDVSLPIERIFERLREPIRVQDQDIRVGASIGVAFYPLDAETPDALEQAADAALLEAKRSGRSRCAYASRGDLSSAPHAARL